mmetsp:Transcript_8684/g.17307  ORF Transcript_8684/g.17307 Transcript_8684/m.17307 type:complete len:163 (+) Transcript_8684:90-578(+)
MKTFSAIAVPLLLVAAGGVKAEETCNIPADVLDSLNFTNLYESCESLGRSPTFDACDTCFSSLLGDFLFKLYPYLDLNYEDFPADPTILASQLMSGDTESLGIDLTGNDPCTPELQKRAEESGADLQTALMGILGCDYNQGWGPNTIETVQEYYPDFVAASP